MSRRRTPRATETDLLVQCRRWCALCFGIHLRTGPKHGQIAHVDRDASNADFDNLCWLCLEHHDDYDTRRSQAKGFTPDELRHHRDDLYSFLADQREQLSALPSATLSDEALAVARLLVVGSRNGRALDPLLRIASLPDEVELSNDDIENAVDELLSVGLVQVNGTGDFVSPTERLFWELDPIFLDNDPSSDAATLARAMLRRRQATVQLTELAAELGWEPRRLNPASRLLHEAGHARGTPVIAGAALWTPSLRTSASTKRFVRDLGPELQS